MTFILFQKTIGHQLNLFISYFYEQFETKKNSYPPKTSKDRWTALPLISFVPGILIPAVFPLKIHTYPPASPLSSSFSPTITFAISESLSSSSFALKITPPPGRECTWFKLEVLREIRDWLVKIAERWWAIRWRCLWERRGQIDVELSRMPNFDVFIGKVKLENEK